MTDRAEHDPYDGSRARPTWSDLDAPPAGFGPVPLGPAEPVDTRALGESAFAITLGSMLLLSLGFAVGGAGPAVAWLVVLLLGSWLTYRVLPAAWRFSGLVGGYGVATLMLLWMV